MSCILANRDGMTNLLHSNTISLAACGVIGPEINVIVVDTTDPICAADFWGNLNIYAMPVGG
jgi:hypothetical protein